MLVRSLPYLLCGVLAVRALGSDEPSPDAVHAAVSPFFRPWASEVAALSPDGRHVVIGTRAGPQARIALIDLTTHTTRTFDIAALASLDSGINGLLWQSPQRLVFTLGNHSVGLLELPSGVVRPILTGADLAHYRPAPQLGPRRPGFGATADMAADPTERTNAAYTRIELPTLEAMIENRVSGDMFAGSARRDGGRMLTPRLLGLTTGSPARVLVELHQGRDPLDDLRVRKSEAVVQSNMVLSDSPRGFDPDNPGPMGLRSSYASYDIVYPPTPHIVLEVEPTRWRRKELVENESWLRVLADPDGRPRLALARERTARVLLHRAARGGRWAPLDKLMAPGIDAGFTVTPERLLQPRAVPLGFDGTGEILYVASNLESDTFALRAIDLASGRFTEIEVVHPGADLVEPTDLVRDDVLVFDPHRRELAGVRFSGGMRPVVWFDPGIEAVQRTVDRHFAPLRARIMEWDTARNRFLLDVSGPGDPGGFHLYDLATGQVHACGRRAPWLHEGRTHPVREFAFKTEGGRRLTGRITLPREPRLDPAPVLVYFHDGPWFHIPPDFDRGAQALAALGFAVLQVNYRGSSGAGREHLLAIHEGLDRAVLDDVRAVLTRASAHLPVNARLAAALGNGFGGYLALRAVQLEPETYRCAVAINAPADIEAWSHEGDSVGGFLGRVRRSFFGGDRAAWRAASAMAAARDTTRPVLVVHGTENAYVSEFQGRTLHAALRASPGGADYLALEGEGHGGWSRRATADLFAELGRFFNDTIYTYGVEIEEATVEE